MIKNKKNEMIIEFNITTIEIIIITMVKITLLST